MNGGGPSRGWLDAGYPALQDLFPVANQQAVGGIPLAPPIPMSTGTTPAGNPTGYPSLGAIPSSTPSPGPGSSGPPTPASNTPPPSTFGALFSGAASSGAPVGLPGASTPVEGGPGQQPISPGAAPGTQTPLPQPPNGGMSSPNEDPTHGMSVAAPAVSQGPPAVGMGTQPAPGEPAPPQAFESQRIGGGGMTKARELPTRGPTQNALLERSYEHPLSAADRIESRSADQAAHEAAVYDQMAQRSLDQQAAMERMQARRSDELAQIRSSYDQTIQQLGTQKIDDGRLWGNTSTPEKIGAIALSFLGGVFGGSGNKIKDAIDKRISNDVEAQKFDYKKGLDIAKSRETAFGLAMQQYGSEDAAQHAATAAAQQYTAAQMGSLAAQWKGTDAANRADDLRAKYQMAADQSKAEGYRYLQPQAVAPKYAVAIGGQAAPAPMTADEANKAFLDHFAKPREAAGQAMVEGDVKATVEDRKIAAEAKVNGGLGKAGAEKLALDEVKANRERDAGLRATAAARSNLTDIVKGTSLGEQAAGLPLPNGVPGIEEARKNVQKRDALNTQIMFAVAGAHRMNTDEASPKQLKTMHEYAKPYTIEPTDNETTARQKLDALDVLLNSGASTKSAEAPPPATPSGVKQGWK